MSASASAPARARRAERRKLTGQLPPRLLAVMCVLGPFAFAALLDAQSGTPSDALFGVWVHTSGFAVALVVLSFAANWGFPIVAGVLAGDLFASEDRHHTWKTVLTRSRSLRQIFAAKVATALTLALILGALLAIASIAAGLIFTGAHPMVDLSGRVLRPAHLLLVTALAWLICLLPLLAYTSLALLCSVASRNGIVGVLGPVLVALLTQLLALIGNGVWLHLLLIGSAFDAWHGLMTAHAYAGPLIVSVLVSVAWIAATLTAAWRILARREFTAGGDPDAAPATQAAHRNWSPAVRLVAIATATVAVLALATSLGPAGVTAPRLAHAMAPEFRRLTALQQAELGHPIPAGARFRILPVCNKRGAKPVGPGDWACTMNVYILLPNTAHPFTDTPIAYDVSVQSNGCYKASSPPVLLGQQQLRTVDGHTVVNPIVTIYGCFDVL